MKPSKLASKVVADVFRKAGCKHVICVDSAREAVEQAETQQFDVVVATRQLPDASGDSLLGRIRDEAASSGPICLLMSSDSPIQLMAQSTITGTSAFVKKQSKPNEILSAVCVCTNHIFPESAAFLSERPLTLVWQW